MRASTASLVTFAYRRVSRPPAPEETVELDDGVTVGRYLVDYGRVAPREAVSFLERMPAALRLEGAEVLDIGCGTGALCLEVARRGARRVVGVDVGHDVLQVARHRRREEAGDLPVEFRRYGGTPDELDGERFDVVLSKDSFERYGLRGEPFDHASMLHQMADRLRPGGLLAMRLGPLWKAPYGGHIESRLPWAHLIFPEPVIFAEYRRVRQPGKTARTFEEGTGVNRLTLARFHAVMRASGLECVHLALNVGDRRALRAMRALARVPPMREFMAQNLYGVWRRPPGWRRPEG